MRFQATLYLFSLLTTCITTSKFEDDFDPISIAGFQKLPCVFHHDSRYFDFLYLHKPTGWKIQLQSSKFGVEDPILTVNFCEGIPHPPSECFQRKSLGFITFPDDDECFQLSREPQQTTESNSGNQRDWYTLWSFPNESST
jgi:hypothetical protein